MYAHLIPTWIRKLGPTLLLITCHNPDEPLKTVRFWSSTALDMDAQSLVDVLAKRWDIEIFFETDCRCATRADLWRYPAPHSRRAPPKTATLAVSSVPSWPDYRGHLHPIGCIKFLKCKDSRLYLTSLFKAKFESVEKLG